jgi:hypothetical protein
LLATLSGFLTLLARLRLSAAALLPALTTLLTALVLTALLLARLLFIRIHNCSLRFLPWQQQTCPVLSSRRRRSASVPSIRGRFVLADRFAG